MKSAFDLHPEKRIPGYPAYCGWKEILSRLAPPEGSRYVITAEFYPQVNREEIVRALSALGGTLFDAEECAIPDDAYLKRISPFLTDDRVFGIMNTLRLEDVFLREKIAELQEQIRNTDGIVIVYGTGASLVTRGDSLLYFDMPRWEIQKRFRRGMTNWKSHNPQEDRLRKFKQGYFVEWRMADRRKKELLPRIDWYLDTCVEEAPRMISGEALRAGLAVFSREPFRLVPYYAPEVWGGQWLKETCGLDPEAENYAWAFDGVPEENSIYIRFGDVRVELPAINVVLFAARKLLGDRVQARFGDEFPIRFDFLDTMGGQNLSLQVHPTTEYIQDRFGMHYTQDESYYIMAASDDSVVYLGLKEGIRPEEMVRDLERAQETGEPFPAEQYVNAFPVRKHDHCLIPAGTVHCSGKNTVVLEISATPYIFTFKLWDWNRLGLDGRPRPVHIGHGKHTIDWNRTTGWVRENLLNRVSIIEKNDAGTVERTGLHPREFIETRRYTLSGEITIEADDSVSMCNIVEGEGAVITSPEDLFPPFTVHYAETFIIPGSIQRFSIRPLDRRCVLLRATVKN